MQRGSRKAAAMTTATNRRTTKVQLVARMACLLEAGPREPDESLLKFGKRLEAKARSVIHELLAAEGVLDEERCSALAWVLEDERCIELLDKLGFQPLQQRRPVVTEGTRSSQNKGALILSKTATRSIGESSRQGKKSPIDSDNTDDDENGGGEAVTPRVSTAVEEGISARQSGPRLEVPTGVPADYLPQTKLYSCPRTGKEVVWQWTAPVVPRFAPP